MVKYSTTRHSGGVDPESMRALVRDYVATLHATYLDHARHLSPGDRAQLPLVAAERVTVVAAAARQLHLLATTDALPRPQGPEVEEHDEYGGLHWTVRFYDPSILPALGLLGDDTAAEVRRVLGVTDVVYHLTVDVGGGLGEHHAQHSGVALANRDASSARDVEQLRRLLPGKAEVVDELAACVRHHLDHAARLLAAELTAGRFVPDTGTVAQECLVAVLADVRR